MPKIYDNIEQHLSEGLIKTLELSKRCDFCVGYFNLRGWHQVADRIDQLSGMDVPERHKSTGTQKDEYRYCRLLVGMQKLPADILRDSFINDDGYLIDHKEMERIRKQLAYEFKEQLTLGTPTERDEVYLRKLSKQLKEKKVVVKLHLRHPLHAKLYLTYSEDVRVPLVGFLGSSNLTLAGLSKQGELNVDVMEQDAAQKLAKWFNDRWNDTKCIDITAELIEAIDESWATDKLLSPYHIYLKIAYHLSREARTGINEFKLPKIFRKELFDFQQKAVLVAAHHLHKRNGVMVGDVVGLGKTIIATALAKIFEDDFYLEALILCPKNIVEMWKDYGHKYQLRAEVMSQSRVIKQLPKLRRYRIIIIDESHNLRNDEGKRYKAIKSYIQENESKVILLTATPYNKSFEDLSNQLRLFIPDDLDLGVSPERYLESLGGKIEFDKKHTDTYVRSIKAFAKSTFSDDWRELMRLYLVRRTRSFIKKYYAETDCENDRKFLTFQDGTCSYFPDRQPQKVEYPFNPDDINDQYAKLYSQDVVNIINDLDLARYGMANFLDDNSPIKPSANEQTIIDNLSRAGKRLKGFCRTNLFKRLESSGYAFLLSLSRHIMRNYIFVYAIKNNLPLPIGKNVVYNLDEYIEDKDLDADTVDNAKYFLMEKDDYLSQAEIVYNKYSQKFSHHFEWINSRLFIGKLKLSLLNDAEKVIGILKQAKKWIPEEDRQLNALHKLISHTHQDSKLLIFTQFADTAQYLYEQLKLKGIEHLECVTGSSENPTHHAHRFSPISNGKPALKDTEAEIRVLISTDVLSEGQNLQDCHIIINYDLPWAIIRLIQRAGRVDRIGQQAEKILCYSFLPEDGVEKIINLRKRLKYRISENAEVVGSDETFFDGDPVNIHDLYNEKAGIFDDEGDEEVDLASYAYQIWKNALDDDHNLAKIIPDMPNVVYATKQNSFDPDKQGVIVYTKTVADNDILTWLDTQGEIISQSQLTILRAAECNKNVRALEKIATHHSLVQEAVAKVTADEIKAGGTLGRKTGIKYKSYMRLSRFIEEKEGTFFVNEDLKRAVDDIYKYPLKEVAKDTLNRQLKAGIDDYQLAELVVSLRDEDSLSITGKERTVSRLPQIICSLGIKNEE